MDELNLLKYKVQLSEAFPELLANTAKHIWLLSHQDKFQYIDEVKRKVDKGGLISLCTMTQALGTEDLKKNINEKLTNFKHNYEKKFATDFLLKEGYNNQF